MISNVAAGGSGRADRIRVVHLITELDIGGAERMLARLVASLDPTAVENTVVSLASGGVVAHGIAASGIRVIALDMTPGRPNLTALVRLVRVLRTIRPHVLQTWLYHADFLGLIAAPLARVPALVWNIRCSELNAGDYSPLLPLLLRVLARTSRWPSAVVSNSTAGQRVHEGLGYRPRRWVLIPNGVDTEVFKPCATARALLRQELGLDAATPLAGLVARLHPMKDHPTFLRAAALVAQRHPEARFIVVGRGVTPSDMLERLIGELGIRGRVHLQDERHDVSRVLAALDVAVSSSDRGEGFPNMLIEAMACGVPCVATDVGDSAAIVGGTGLVVPPKDPAALAEGVLSMLTMAPAERDARARAARDRVVGEFSLQFVTGRYQNLYEQLANTGAVIL